MRRAFIAFLAGETLVAAALVLFFCAGYARWALWALATAIAATLLAGLVFLFFPKGKGPRP